ncbi:MAG: deoxyguanosinetriphosphate triphosphohydrolase [Spirochaetia bacterium]|nr:deoxyguanosinetriphosphate triphosphohydrolase [Spirochaetia bacterium]
MYLKNSIKPFGIGKDDFINRVYPQSSHTYRNDFQRDRDRIVHSKAFRRLEYKTQVFVNHLGDSYRTRLTHSIEVSQIARTVARSLQLNEDLTETIALAHDLGHPPFGHAGERALHMLMPGHGGFDHNEQTIRVVTILEERYPEFIGLNLTEATLMGLHKHGRPDGRGHSLESQIVDISDEIAYNNHDLDDGIDGGYLSLEEIGRLQIWKRAWTQVEELYPEGDAKILIRSAIRWLIDHMVTDLIVQTEKNIEKFKIQTLEDVLNHKKGKLVEFSQQVDIEINELKSFLFKKLYRHPDVVSMNMRAEEIVKRLFTFFSKNPEALPEEFQKRISPECTAYRVVCDFIAGMTDRYALFWNKKILGLDA